MSVLVGLIIGLVLGLTGAGGSVFAVPLLILLLGLPVTEAIGLSLGAVAVTALWGALMQFRSGRIQWSAALVYAVTGATLAPLGSRLGQWIPELWLLMAFSLMVVVIAVRMWHQARQAPQESAAVRAAYASDEPPQAGVCQQTGEPFSLAAPCLVRVVAGAGLTGLLSGLFGVGGGFLIVPTLMSLTGLPVRQAVATSLVVIAVISSAGFTGYLLHSPLPAPDLLLPVISGGVLGMLAGSFASRWLAGALLQKVFALLLLVMAGVTLFTHTG